MKYFNLIINPLLIVAITALILQFLVNEWLNYFNKPNISFWCALGLIIIPVIYKQLLFYKNEN